MKKPEWRWARVICDDAHLGTSDKFLTLGLVVQVRLGGFQGHEVREIGDSSLIWRRNRFRLLSSLELLARAAE